MSELRERRRSVQHPRTAAAFILALVIPMGCDEPSGSCKGAIDIQCDGLDDCWCGKGAFAGESCIYDEDSREPEVCEVKCCEGAAQPVPGPPSILRGTR